MATLLVQKGTLNIGDIVVAGAGFGKIKVIHNDKGESIESAGPSVPVEVLGLNELPGAGEEFSVVKIEKQAREIIEYRKKKQRDLAAVANKVSAPTPSSDDEDESAESALDKLFQSAQSGNKELRVIIKGDVQGSVEAIIGSLEKMTAHDFDVKIVHSAAGGITESDTTLAAATGAIILGFNVRASNAVKTAAEEENIDVRYYSVIYDLIDDMKAVASGMLEPIIHENFIGYAEILQVFKITKAGKIAGCKVTEGNVKRGAGVRLIRDDVVIHEGKLKTLKRFKEEAQEVKEGTECGMAFENYEDIKVGDVIEAFEIVEEKRVIE